MTRTGTSGRPVRPPAPTVRKLMLPTGCLLPAKSWTGISDPTVRGRSATTSTLSSERMFVILESEPFTLKAAREMVRVMAGTDMPAGAELEFGSAHRSRIGGDQTSSSNPTVRRSSSVASPVCHPAPPGARRLWHPASTGSRVRPSATNSPTSQQEQGCRPMAMNYRA